MAIDGETCYPDGKCVWIRVRLKAAGEDEWNVCWEVERCNPDSIGETISEQREYFAEDSKRTLIGKPFTIRSVPIRKDDWLHSPIAEFLGYVSSISEDDPILLVVDDLPDHDDNTPRPLIPWHRAEVPVGRRKRIPLGLSVIVLTKATPVASSTNREGRLLRDCRVMLPSPLYYDPKLRHMSYVCNPTVRGIVSNHAADQCDGVFEELDKEYFDEEKLGNIAGYKCKNMFHQREFAGLKAAIDFLDGNVSSQAVIVGRLENHKLHWAANEVLHNTFPSHFYDGTARSWLCLPHGEHPRVDHPDWQRWAYNESGPPNIISPDYGLDEYQCYLLMGAVTRLCWLTWHPMADVARKLRKCIDRSSCVGLKESLQIAASEPFEHVIYRQPINFRWTETGQLVGLLKRRCQEHEFRGRIADAWFDATDESLDDPSAAVPRDGWDTAIHSMFDSGKLLKLLSDLEVIDDDFAEVCKAIREKCFSIWR